MAPTEGEADFEHPEGTMRRLCAWRAGKVRRGVWKARKESWWQKQLCLPCSFAKGPGRCPAYLQKPSSLLSAINCWCLNLNIRTTWSSKSLRLPPVQAAGAGVPNSCFSSSARFLLTYTPPLPAKRLTDAKEREEDRGEESHAFRYHPLSPFPLVHPLFIFRSIKNLFPRKLKCLKKPRESQQKLEYLQRSFLVTAGSPTVRSASLLLNRGQFCPPAPPPGDI